MKREIKFRAWDSKENKMLYWDFLKDKQAKFLGYNWLISQQYTGLKDKNGKEIYEGDIVRCSDDLIEEMEWIDDSNWMGQCNVVGFVNHSKIYKQPVEIIGNIYENPDLLTLNKE